MNALFFEDFQTGLKVTSAGRTVSDTRSPRLPAFQEISTRSTLTPNLPNRPPLGSGLRTACLGFRLPPAWLSRPVS